MEETAVLERGGVIVYPTDTIWGLGCDATNPEAIQRLLEIKKREKGKSLILLVKDEKMLGNYVEQVPEAARQVLALAERPTTIIYPKAKNLPIKLLSENLSIGIRIPKHAYCQNFLAEFGKPIVSTSANFSGQPAPSDFSEIDSGLLALADFVSKQHRGDKPQPNPSSIFLIEQDGSLKQLR